MKFAVYRNYILLQGHFKPISQNSKSAAVKSVWVRVPPSAR
uniref:Uncharacterized protein n=1 Tax=Phage sp. ctPjm15 TaxID=2828006 RepID=A0A8S5SPW5_9VIRU|nr:MAG TPA: hypothetical protein [Phage sp. ctPjm15]DAY67873.1 MAG TPA: hypothetical protein [Caudoviricetes sp.]DAZ59817.1 MAG TPA: hypothetical protein [Caudoviricetes sp.]